jgi:hypothetical protein
MNTEENRELKNLDEYLNELEYVDFQGDPDPAKQMKAQLIKNIGLEGLTVKELPDEQYQLTWKGKTETYDFENLLKKLIELAKTTTAAERKAQAQPTPPSPAPAPVKANVPAQVQV